MSPKMSMSQVGQVKTDCQKVIDLFVCWTFVVIGLDSNKTNITNKSRTTNHLLHTGSQMACKNFHKGKYYVTFKRGFEDNKRDITVSVEKVFESDTLVCS